MLAAAAHGAHDGQLAAQRVNVGTEARAVVVVLEVAIVVLGRVQLRPQSEVAATSGRASRRNHEPPDGSAGRYVAGGGHGLQAVGINAPRRKPRAPDGTTRARRGGRALEGVVAARPQPLATDRSMAAIPDGSATRGVRPAATEHSARMSVLDVLGAVGPWLPEAVAAGAAGYGVWYSHQTRKEQRELQRRLETTAVGVTVRALATTRPIDAYELDKGDEQVWRLRVSAVNLSEFPVYVTTIGIANPRGPLDRGGEGMGVEKRMADERLDRGQPMRWECWHDQVRFDAVANGVLGVVLLATGELFVSDVAQLDPHESDSAPA
jgi:hypothetical protein